MSQTNPRQSGITVSSEQDIIDNESVSVLGERSTELLYCALDRFGRKEMKWGSARTTDRLDGTKITKDSKEGRK
jgi:hypothetical protein